MLLYQLLFEYGNLIDENKFQIHALDKITEMFFFQKTEDCKVS